MARNPLFYARNLKLLERNKSWLIGGQRLKYKVAYYPAILWSYVGQVIKHTKSIHYLGQRFVFDNPATPLNLQVYPHEITSKILSHMSKSPRKVLDVGGNVGQFSVTLKRLLRTPVHIDIFEPNHEIFPLLMENIAGLHDIRAYNYALGDQQQSTKLFVEAGRSATGSMIKENASDASGSLHQVAVAMTDSVKSVTRQSRYDLIKIDVEGYEFQTLHALRNLKTNYLYVEMSAARGRSYVHSDFLSVVTQQFGSFDIVYASPISEEADVFELLFHFVTNRET